MPYIDTVSSVLTLARVSEKLSFPHAPLKVLKKSLSLSVEEHWLFISTWLFLPVMG